ncbi:hypothetical protein [Haloferula sp. BvORR071]|uniref:hypothetical protein n=1 Tax=Haloferula sp. BvORR071 TaxID=1396141 RepID=UPI00054DE57A|nr:hypothetical protein [Haloferula sp. BvORR071]
MRPTLHLLAFALLLVLFLVPSRGQAQDTLCYVLMTVPKLEAPIVRYEMATAPAKYFADGEDFFTSTRGVRRLIYLGKATMSGKEQVDLKGYLPPSLSYRGPWERYDTNISITTARLGEGSETTLSVDAKILLQGNQVIDPQPGMAHFIHYAATSQVPLRPNAWQEVAYWSVDHYCQMLWLYAFTKGAPKAAPLIGKAQVDPELPPLYRLEVIIGRLPEDSFALLPSADAARRAILAESSAVHANKWTAFSVHCLPGQPFASRTALGLTTKRKKDTDYEASCSTTLSGSLQSKLGSVALQSEFRTAAPKKEDRITISLAANLVPGEWHIQQIAEQPVIYESGHTPRRQYQMIDGQERQTPVRANAAFYRVVEVTR